MGGCNLYINKYELHQVSDKSLMYSVGVKPKVTCKLMQEGEEKKKKKMKETGGSEAERTVYCTQYRL